LIRLAEAHPEWVLDYVDEVWWSRLAQPRLHTWNADEPLRYEFILNFSIKQSWRALKREGVEKQLFALI
jgi:hypothetical protein